LGRSAKAHAASMGCKAPQTLHAHQASRQMWVAQDRGGLHNPLMSMFAVVRKNIMLADVKLSASMLPISNWSVQLDMSFSICTNTVIKAIKPTCLEYRFVNNAAPFTRFATSQH